MAQKETPNHVTPYLILKNASEAIKFYEKAFNAKETYRLTKDDNDSVIIHGTIQIGESQIYLADECDGNDPHANLFRSPATLNATSVVLHIYTDDVDALFEQALNAGAEQVMPLTDMFWGDRYCQVKDPFGHLWSLATHKKQLTPEEIIKEGRKAMNPE